MLFESIQGFLFSPEVLLRLLLVLFPAEIQRMKNSVPKNDKKKRKQLTEDIAKLEADLNQKHEEELRQLTSDTKVNVVFSGLWDPLLLWALADQPSH